MTQTPPVSPDFAAMARKWFRSHESLDDLPVSERAAALATFLEGFATLSHAAGRAEGLVEAAKIVRASIVHDREEMKAGVYSQELCLMAILTAKQILEKIEALASDPVAGDQVAKRKPREQRPLSDESFIRECVKGDAEWHRNPSPAPAPGLAAQEVERLCAIETAARTLRERLHSEDTMRAWDRWRRAIETMPGASLPRDSFENWLCDLTGKLDAALSAPRPAQAKEGDQR